LNEIGADGGFRHCLEEKAAVYVIRAQNTVLKGDLTTQEAKDRQGDDGAVRLWRSAKQ